MASEKGVWRTIGGRRVFIKEGESLSDAMKRSGKFTTKQIKEKEEPKTFFEGKKDIEEEAKQIYAEEGIRATSDQYVKYFAEKYDIPQTQAKQFIEETAKKFDEENRRKNTIEERISEKKKTLGKGLKDFEDETINNDKAQKAYETLGYNKMSERTEEEKQSDERYAYNKMMYKKTGEEKYKNEYQDELKKTSERIRKEVETEKNKKALGKGLNDLGKEKLDENVANKIFTKDKHEGQHRLEGTKMWVDNDYEDRLDRYETIRKTANNEYKKGNIDKTTWSETIDNAHDKYIKQKETSIETKSVRTFTASIEAYNEYKRQHPETKLTYSAFKKMNKNK